MFILKVIEQHLLFDLTISNLIHIPTKKNLLNNDFKLNSYNSYRI